MILFRDRNTRGRTETGWLDSRHTFSFAQYLDPAHMGFRALRVINEDRVIPGAGFSTHSHRNMEIITYVMSGALEHKDSLGTGSVIRPGDVQRMSAGTGVTHSELNHSRGELVHFLQIWIVPGDNGLPPSYEQKSFPPEERLNRLRLVGSPDGADGSVMIHRDVRLFVADLEAGQGVSHSLAVGRYAWLQIVRGIVELNEGELREGDGAGLTDERWVAVAARSRSELLLFDLD